MHCRNTWRAAFAVAALVGCAAVAAQDLKFPTPELIERGTTTDEQGLQKWAEYVAPKCPTCAGTGKMKCVTCVRFGEDATNCPECHRKEGHQAVCRACAGAGTIADPLEKALCPGCMGASFLLCMVCGGGGQLKVDKAKNWSDCPGCRGDGGFPCTVCKGERVVETVALKPSLAEAPADKVKKALATAEEGLAKLAAFNPTGGNNVRKEIKEIGAIFDGMKALHPAFKTLPKASKDYLGKVLGGTQFQGHEEHEADAMKLVKQNAEYFLKHQKRMMELVLKRAEANEKVAGK